MNLFEWFAAFVVVGFFSAMVYAFYRWYWEIQTTSKERIRNERNNK